MVPRDSYFDVDIPCVKHSRLRGGWKRVFGGRIVLGNILQTTHCRANIGVV